jgi:hypothetical protein
MAGLKATRQTSKSARVRHYADAQSTVSTMLHLKKSSSKISRFFLVGAFHGGEEKSRLPARKTLSWGGELFG